MEDATAEAVEKIGMRSILSRFIIGEGELATHRVSEAEELYQNTNQLYFMHGDKRMIRLG